MMLLLLLKNVEKIYEKLGLSAKGNNYINARGNKCFNWNYNCFIRCIFTYSIFKGEYRVIYQQFSDYNNLIYGSISYCCTHFNSALCATILKPHSEKSSGFIFKFNQYFEALQINIHLGLEN